MINRIKAVTKKEIKQLKRDKRFLGVLFFFPVFLLVIFGYAVNFDVKKIQISIYDQDHSTESREFINSLLSSEYFNLVEYIEHPREIDRHLDMQKSQVVLVIPKSFSKNIYRLEEFAKVQFIIDGINGNTATIIQNYVVAATQKYNIEVASEFLASKGRSVFIPVRLEPQFWFNPELSTSVFLVPGLIAMILIVTAVISVSLSLVREKERGTIEQLNVSSLTSFEMLLGKSLPYILISLLNAVLILIAGYFLFGVIVKGSFLLLFLTTLLFIIASTNIGVFVSAVSNSQQVAFSIATFLSLLPAMILSGFIFPIDSMPVFIQVLTNITPAKFYLNAIRAIILRGVGIEAFWQQLVYLSLFALFFISLAVKIDGKKR